MRNVSFHVGLVNAAASGMRQARALLSGRKRFNYGSAVLLAVLVTPFVMQAASAMLADGSDDTHFLQPAAQTLADTDDTSGASSESEPEAETDTESKKEVEVTVNGQNIPVPEGGSIHKEMKDNNSKTTVDVQVDNDSGANGSSYQSTTITVDGHSYNSSDEQQERGVRRNRMAR